MRPDLDAPDEAAASLQDASILIGDLLQAIAESPHLGARVLDDEYLQQLLVQAFIEAELARLFDERNRRLAIREIPLTYEQAQAQLQAERAARAALGVTRDALGPFALLNANDPRAPASGA